MSQLKKLASQTALYGLSNVGAKLINYLLNPLLSYALVDAAGKAANGMGAVVAHIPVATRVQAEPAVAMRDIGPLGHRLFNYVVHALYKLACVLIEPPAQSLRQGAQMSGRPVRGKTDVAAMVGLPQLHVLSNFMRCGQ